MPSSPDFDRFGGTPTRSCQVFGIIKAQLSDTAPTWKTLPFSIFKCGCRKTESLPGIIAQKIEFTPVTVDPKYHFIWRI